MKKQIIILSSLVGVICVGVGAWLLILSQTAKPSAVEEETVSTQVRSDTTKSQQAQPEAKQETVASLEIKELAKSLDMTHAPYDDIKYHWMTNSEAGYSYTAAVYSEDLNRRLVDRWAAVGELDKSDIDERLSCNRAVYVRYAVEDAQTGYLVSVDPQSLPSAAQLTTGWIGSCDAGAGSSELSDENQAFRDWVEKSLR